jgi:hypothetical protein
MALVERKRCPAQLHLVGPARVVNGCYAGDDGDTLFQFCQPGRWRRGTWSADDSATGRRVRGSPKPGEPPHGEGINQVDVIPAKAGGPAGLA